MLQKCYKNVAKVDAETRNDIIVLEDIYNELFDEENIRTLSSNRSLNNENGKTLYQSPWWIKKQSVRTNKQNYENNSDPNHQNL